VNNYQMVINFTPPREELLENAGTILAISNDLSFDEYYYEMMEKAPYLSYGWGYLNTSNIQNARFVLPIVPPGCGLIWDSRIFHQGYPGIADYKCLRTAAYVSFDSREFSTKKDREKRIKIYERGNGTGHWSIGPWLSEVTMPRHYGNEPILPPVFSPNDDEIEDVRKLIGY
ncbi:MAG: hypothetical protein O2U61_05255, partial [Candidatus Bathyarchaeota archaeon]|nr:hypothetical protein [Candidatus Bathyarchaeota archaeon]